MSLFVLEESEIFSRPKLLTFGYAKTSTQGERRRWIDILRLNKFYQWLSLGFNVALVLLASVMIVYIVGKIGFKDRRSLLYLTPLLGLVPGIIKLFNLLIGKGYSLDAFESNVKGIVNRARTNMRGQA